MSDAAFEAARTEELAVGDSYLTRSSSTKAALKPCNGSARTAGQRLRLRWPITCNLRAADPRA